MVAEPFLQTLGAAEHATEVADVLTEDHDVVVALHRDDVRIADRLDHRHRRHDVSPNLLALLAKVSGDLGVHVVEHGSGAADVAGLHRPVGVGFGERLGDLGVDLFLQRLVAGARPIRR